MQIMEVKFSDGRQWRVGCENKSQRLRVMRMCDKLGDKVISVGYILDSIHSTSDFIYVMEREYVKQNGV